MPRKVGHAIHDILEAIDRVEQITRGKTLSDFEVSWQLRWLVQRANEIISEASRAIPDELTSMRPEIPWPKVRGIGLDELPRLKAAVVAIAATVKE
jgi:uncharacterized protein with HEPN domain